MPGTGPSTSSNQNSSYVTNDGRASTFGRNLIQYIQNRLPYATDGRGENDALNPKYKIFKKSTPDEEFNARISKHYFYKLSDQQARLLLRQLKLIDVINEASKAASDYYDEFLKGIYGLKTHNMQACEDCHYSLIRYPILIEHRDMFLKAMVANSIDDGLWFSAPISSPDVDATIFGYEAGSCPAAEEVAGRMLNLPTNVRLRRSDLERIVGLCRSVANGINA